MPVRGGELERGARARPEAEPEGSRVSRPSLSSRCSCSMVVVYSIR